MTDSTMKYALLQNLLERLEADARSERPLFRGVVSDAERNQLRELLHQAEAIPERPASPEEDAGEGGGVGDTPQTTEPSEYPIDETVLDFDGSPNPEWMLCLDFGTAKSKAFAWRNDTEESLDLPLGKLDQDLDDAIYSVSSSMWIDDDGLMFAGSEAVKRGAQYGGSVRARQRIDSIKQEISQIDPDLGFENKRLGSTLNPISSVPLTYQDAITFCLAYLTDLAATELEAKVGARYVRRRFTIPWWKEAQREWAESFIAQVLVRAQVVADTFHGKWRKGIHVSEVEGVLRRAASLDDRLMWLLDRGQESGEGSASAPRARGILEALAAASGRISKDPARGLMLVVDVGAGTTDVSLFWRAGGAAPVRPYASAIKQAGDTLDSLLLKELLQRSHLGADPDLERRVRDALLRRSVRRLKERLFETGRISERLSNDQLVELTEQEFLDLEGISTFTENIRRTVQDLLDKVHESWGAAAAPDKGSFKIILTGGGCDLPMIRALANEQWAIGNRKVRCRMAESVPDFVADELGDEFAREYPQLAVAMGGAMPLLLDERRALEKWAGDAPTRGSIERPTGSGFAG